MLVGRSMRTHVTSYSALRREFLIWIDQHAKDPMDNYHFLYPTVGREYINRNNLTIEQLENYRPDAKKDKEENRRIKEDKLKDKKKTGMFASSKV